MPLAAVIDAGRPSVSSGSQSAIFGRRNGCAIPVLTLSLGRSRTATAVTSEPVPDVVGTATTGISGPGGTRAPPSGALIQSRSVPPCVAISAATFAESSAEPPPTPSTPSAPLATHASATSRIESSVGSPVGTAYVTTSRPSARTAASIGATMPLCRRKASVTRNTRCAPSAFRW